MSKKIERKNRTILNVNWPKTPYFTIEELWILNPQFVNITLRVRLTKEIEKGNYEPAFAKDGAFCIFQKTESSREFGDDLPVKITKKEKPSELKEIFEAVGYQVTVIQYDAVGFIGVWAVKAGSRCMRCREALKAKVLEVLCS